MHLKERISNVREIEWHYETATNFRSGAKYPVNAGGFEPTHEQIASRAYERWLERGSEHGEHEQDWMDAEQDLKDPL